LEVSTKCGAGAILMRRDHVPSTLRRIRTHFCSIARGRRSADASSWQLLIALHSLVQDVECTAGRLVPREEIGSLHGRLAHLATQ